MMPTRRKPAHPGAILYELYIKPLDLNLEKLAERLRISKEQLDKILSGQKGITPGIANSLAQEFDTTPQLWLNLQQSYIQSRTRILGDIVEPTGEKWDAES